MTNPETYSAIPDGLTLIDTGLHGSAPLIADAIRQRTRHALDRSSGLPLRSRSRFIPINSRTGR
jgi:hypothetical protein